MVLGLRLLDQAGIGESLRRQVVLQGHVHGLGHGPICRSL
jgi:hypothetical protein